MPPTSRPAPGDLEGWRRAKEASEALWEPLVAQMLAASRCRIDTECVAGVMTYRSTPAEANDPTQPLYLYFHGGAFANRPAPKTKAPPWKYRYRGCVGSFASAGVLR